MPNDAITVARLDPIFCRVKVAAEMLGMSTWQIYKLLDEQKIESRYEGTARLVVVTSLREYAANLPTTGPEPTPEAIA